MSKSNQKIVIPEGFTVEEYTSFLNSTECTEILKQSLPNILDGVYRIRDMVNYLIISQIKSDYNKYYNIISEEYQDIQSFEEESLISTEDVFNGLQEYNDFYKSI